MFSSEIGDHERELHHPIHHGRAYVEGSVMFTDMTTRNLETTPAVDVYIAGAPCQSWSTCGNKRGYKDARGKLLFKCLEYIHAKATRFSLDLSDELPCLTKTWHLSLIHL